MCRVHAYTVYENVLLFFSWILNTGRGLTVRPPGRGLQLYSAGTVNIHATFHENRTSTFREINSAARTNQQTNTTDANTSTGVVVILSWLLVAKSRNWWSPACMWSGSPYRVSDEVFNLIHESGLNGSPCMPVRSSFRFLVSPSSTPLAQRTILLLLLLLFLLLLLLNETYSGIESKDC